jgi:methionine synthase II (cobalamin-independent)
MQEENEAEEELLDAIATALTVVLKKFGDAAMPYVDALMPAVGTLLVRRRCDTGSGTLV